MTWKSIVEYTCINTVVSSIIYHRTINEAAFNLNKSISFVLSIVLFYKIHLKAYLFLFNLKMVSFNKCINAWVTVQMRCSKYFKRTGYMYVITIIPLGKCHMIPPQIFSVAQVSIWASNMNVQYVTQQQEPQNESGEIKWS